MYHIHYLHTTFDLQASRIKFKDTHMDDEGMIFGDIFLSTPKPPRDDRLRDHARQYVSHFERSEEIKASLSYLKDILLSDLPEEPGEYPIEMDDSSTLVVSIPEKWTWDKKLLKEIYSSAGLPECVSQSFTVDRKKFEAASDDVKEVLRKALTIQCGLPTIKVRK